MSQYERNRFVTSLAKGGDLDYEALDMLRPRLGLVP